VQTSAGLVEDTIPEEQSLVLNTPEGLVVVTGCGHAGIINLQGWAELRRQLEYKLAWNGGRLIAVPTIHTSRTCPECGCSCQGNRKTQAGFCCVECGYEANADLVAAINVGRAGLAIASPDRL
jgi:transposase